MAKPVNTKKPIRFYDDRGKEKEKILLDKILFEDEHNCLCTVKADWYTKGEEKILFKKSDGTVLTENFTAWYAENYDTEQMKTAQKAIDHVKETQCHFHVNQPYMLLGDVAKLIEITTGVLPTLEELEFKK